MFPLSHFLPPEGIEEVVKKSVVIMYCLQIASQRGKEGIRNWSVTCAPATTALFIKIQFQNPLRTKDEKFCSNGWAWARRFLFSLSFASPGCSLLRLLWIFCRCEKAPRERQAAHFYLHSS